MYEKTNTLSGTNWQRPQPSRSVEHTLCPMMDKKRALFPYVMRVKESEACSLGQTISKRAHEHTLHTHTHTHTHTLVYIIRSALVRASIAAAAEAAFGEPSNRGD